MVAGLGVTGGVFDILHVGHIAMLHECRKRCDKLIVLLNTDASARRLAKEFERPIIHHEDRKTILQELRCVDEVLLFDTEDEKTAILTELQPEVWFKSKPYSRETTVETPQIESQGGRIEIIPILHQTSTTDIIKRIKALEEES